MFMPPVREFSNAIINPPSRYKRPKAPYKYRKNKYLDKGKELQRRREGPRLRPLRDVRPQPMRQYDLPAPTKRIVAKALLRGAERLGLKVVTSLIPTCGSRPMRGTRTIFTIPETTGQRRKTRATI